MAINDLNQPAKLWLADCVNNLANCVRDGQYPTMDIVAFGVTFEFRVKLVEIGDKGGVMSGTNRTASGAIGQPKRFNNKER